MAGFLDAVRERVLGSVFEGQADSVPAADIDDKIALGVLLWVVAEADSKFLPEEKEQIKEILKSSAGISDDHLRVVMASVEEAARERIDIQKFTHEVSEGLPYAKRVSVIEQLFRVACADQNLADSELETIRKISGLFRVDHQDFIASKLKIKKEFGLDIASF